jgi:predicted dehydrogenase
MMCDISAARLDSLNVLYSDVVAEKSFEHMLSGAGLDAVVVATSVKLHFPMARAALLAGRHVLIEKPMAASAAQCGELIEIARQKGLVLVAPLEKIRIFDARVERPPHYDTFAEFQYAYHYGDISSPYLKQEEPLKVECLHFLECIRESKSPLTCGARGLELIRILEASSASLKQEGGAVPFVRSEAWPSAETDADLSAQTKLHDAVVRVDPIWKTKGGSARPSPLSVSFPVSSAEEEKV